MRCRTQVPCQRPAARAAPAPGKARCRTPAGRVAAKDRFEVAAEIPGGAHEARSHEASRGVPVGIVRPAVARHRARASGPGPDAANPAGLIARGIPSDSGCPMSASGRPRHRRRTAPGRRVRDAWLGRGRGRGIGKGGRRCLPGNRRPDAGGHPRSCPATLAAEGWPQVVAAHGLANARDAQVLAGEVDRPRPGQHSPVPPRAAPFRSIPPRRRAA